MSHSTKDFSCLDLSLYLNNCQAHYPYSDQYEKNYPQKNGKWWMDKNELIVGGQKIHLITYLGSCYKLNHKRDCMSHVWGKNGFKNAAGLIWLLEALGANEEDIKNAYNAGEQVAKSGGTQPQQSNAIKEAVSWEQIKELCKNKNIRPPMK